MPAIKQKIKTVIKGQERVIKRIYKGTENGKQIIYDGSCTMLKYIDAKMPVSDTTSCYKYIDNEWKQVDFSFPELDDLGFLFPVPTEPVEWGSTDYYDIKNIWYGGCLYFALTESTFFFNGEYNGYYNHILYSKNGQDWFVGFPFSVSDYNEFHEDLPGESRIIYTYYNNNSFFFDNRSRKLYKYEHNTKKVSSISLKDNDFFTETSGGSKDYANLSGIAYDGKYFYFSRKNDYNDGEFNRLPISYVSCNNSDIESIETYQIATVLINPTEKNSNTIYWNSIDSISQQRYVWNCFGLYKTDKNKVYAIVLAKDSTGSDAKPIGIHLIRLSSGQVDVSNYDNFLIYSFSDDVTLSDVRLCVTFNSYILECKYWAIEEQIYRSCIFNVSLNENRKKNGIIYLKPELINAFREGLGDSNVNTGMISYSNYWNDDDVQTYQNLNYNSLVYNLDLNEKLYSTYASTEGIEHIYKEFWYDIDTNEYIKTEENKVRMGIVYAYSNNTI